MSAVEEVQEVVGDTVPPLALSLKPEGELLTGSSL